MRAAFDAILLCLSHFSHVADIVVSPLLVAVVVVFFAEIYAFDFN